MNCRVRSKQQGKREYTDGKNECPRANDPPKSYELGNDPSTQVSAKVALGVFGAGAGCIAVVLRSVLDSPVGSGAPPGVGSDSNLGAAGPRAG